MSGACSSVPPGSGHFLWTSGFPGGSVVKNQLANAGDAGSILGQEDPLEEEMATYSGILARIIL